MSDAPDHVRPRRRWRRVLLVLALLTLGLVLLLVSAKPAVEAQGPPDAQNVQAAADAVGQLRDRNGIVRLTLTNRELHGLATLAGDATGVERIDAHVADGRFKGAASLPLPLWGWINTNVAISGRHEGFPDLHLRIGHLPLPVWMTRWVVAYGRAILRWRGADLPPLDELVRSMAVTNDAVTAEVNLPRRSGLVRGLARLQGVRVDDDAVAATYCQLVALDRKQPAPALDEQVRRAFQGAPGVAAADRNRAALVALAWLAVDSRVSHLAPDAAERILACGRLARPILLGGREDLAKHWTLSAALSAVFGSGTARAIGEWKELDDSLPDGTGFSFVDLAADRSGVHVAQRATDPVVAAAERKRLAAIDEAQLLPIALLAAEEGLTEQQFLERYGTVKAERYQVTVARIDRQLAQAARRPAG